MKKHLFVSSIIMLTALFGASSTGAQVAPRDSVVIAFDEQTRIIIYGADRKEIAKLSQYDFNKLIGDVLKKLDSLPPTDGVTEDSIDGSIYLKPKTRAADQPERALPRNEKESKTDRHSTSETKSTTIFSWREKEHDFPGDSVTVERSTKKYGRRSPRQGIDFRIGFNTYGEREWGAYNAENFNLHTGASRFVSVGMVRSLPVIRGKESSFFMDFGLDVSWFNLMFEGSDVIRKESSGLLFSAQLDDAGQPLRLKKNKLVSPHINLSLMPTLTFRNPVISHVSAGVYGGYRIGGYRKIRPYRGAKSRVSSDFYMQDIHYGLALEVGLRYLPDLFVNYDMNSLFEQGKGPQVRMLSFGLRI